MLAISMRYFSTSSRAGACMASLCISLSDTRCGGMAARTCSAYCLPYFIVKMSEQIFSSCTSACSLGATQMMLLTASSMPSSSSFIWVTMPKRASSRSQYISTISIASTR
uniref:Putative secreted protein n=1 Tax=Anopheles triannulatus TaxID=58253 RepID=A0A2M4B1N9_9DIPT